MPTNSEAAVNESASAVDQSDEGVVYGPESLAKLTASEDSPRVEAGFPLKNVTNINVVVGRNGAGKSRLLREIHQRYRNNNQFRVTYISPERTGAFKTDANIQQNMSNLDWLKSVRAKNQAQQFKETAAVHLARLELIFYRSGGNKDGKDFATEYLGKINEMLLNLRIVFKANMEGFEFQNTLGETVEADSISSGESEAATLAAEVMYFLGTAADTGTNILLMDEPDVHLHPDLQARFARFLLNQMNGLSPEVAKRTLVIIATHSTSLVCALGVSELTSIGTKHFGAETVQQRIPNVGLKKALPFFGHPLSLAISDDPLIIVEGEDDERVWAQVARSTQGRVSLFPCLAYGKSFQPELEAFCADILQAVYDDPRAFSICDGDGRRGGELKPQGCIRRFRLDCYSIENAMVTDEALAQMGSTWTEFQEKATKWASQNTTHQDIDLLTALINATDRLRDKKMKSIRQLVSAILGKDRPWEITLGQAIGMLQGAAPSPPSPHSLASFLGVDFLVAIGVHSGTIRTGTAA